jgi:CRP/FNR family transcriptional regulator, cyclic AMP receptor protein
MLARGLGRLVSEHPFFAGLAARHCELISGCARNVRFDAGGICFAKVLRLTNSS